MEGRWLQTNGERKTDEEDDEKEGDDEEGMRRRTRERVKREKGHERRVKGEGIIQRGYTKDGEGC